MKVHLQKLTYRLDGEKGYSMAKRKYHVSFRCYYDDRSKTNHHQVMTLGEIPKWLEAYDFTHPKVQSITVRYWPNDPEEE